MKLKRVDVGSWPLADTPATDRRGSFRGQSGHQELERARQLLTRSGHEPP